MKKRERVWVCVYAHAQCNPFNTQPYNIDSGEREKNLLIQFSARALPESRSLPEIQEEQTQGQHLLEPLFTGTCASGGGFHRKRERSNLKWT
jgi:hypothetical protein